MTDWHKDRLDRALVEMNKYKALSEKLVGLYNTSKKNRYYWSLSLALYNLQITAPKLLLALKECDHNENDKQKTGLENVKKALQEFHQAWTDVEAVYGQTRFISYPAGYVPDRYFHLASQREDLTWMIQAEELYFGMIEKWMQSQQ